MRERINSVDFVRGFVMVIMALDHVRDFFHYQNMEPTNLATTSPELFFTRWITHFCAPIFVFLAGTGAYLQLTRGKPKKELSWFLFTRGIWLVIVENTLVRSGWTFRPFDFSFLVEQVIWALGCSMIVLAALIHLRTSVVAGIGIIMILVHNAFDTVPVDWSNPLGFLWALLHTGNMLTPMQGLTIMPFYPLIPWIGVMAVGYAFGSLFTLERARRERLMMQIGIGVIAAFLLVRGMNVYGDPRPWSLQKDWIFNVLSFLNCSKYPPSLEYLLMTLGPGILLLSKAEALSNRFAQAIIVFGRVPMFYYLLHIPLIHAMSLVFETIRTGNSSYLFGLTFMNRFPDDYGYPLGVVYLVWIGIVLLLYPACVWYSGVKKRSTNPLFSYL